MSMFSSIMDKIFHHPTATADATAASPATPTSGAPASTPASTEAASQAPVAAPAAPAAVDVGAVLTQMASQKGGGGNYQTSIVDLLKLLDLDSSLAARKTLAEELNVNAGEAGSAEENVALHKAVVAKLAENGGKIPASMQG